MSTISNKLKSEMNRDSYCYSKWKQLSHEKRMDWSTAPDASFYGRPVSWYLERDGKEQKLEFYKKYFTPDESLKNLRIYGEFPKIEIPNKLTQLGKVTFDYGTIEKATLGRLTIREEKKMRIVRVFILDNDEDVPVENRILYDSGEVTTEDTDQDIYLTLNVNMKELLTKHNTKRRKIIDPELSAEHGRDVFLPTIKIQDLTKRIHQVFSL